jgi:hypothetical protein
MRNSKCVEVSLDPEQGTVLAVMAVGKPDQKPGKDEARMTAT